jgi:two-component system CheB/CheR fusion protein
MDVGRHFEFEHKTPAENSRVFNIRGRVLKPDGELFLLITIEDITAHKEVEGLLSLERERLASEVASTARELGRTQDELRALAGSLITSQEEERRRVARELHDDICQRLALLEIDTQQIEPGIARDANEARRQLEQVRTGIGALSDEVRRISHALHPSVIDDLGVAPGIRSLVDDFREREHMIVTFSAQQVPDGIPSQIATGLYRIAQEALRNVAKHAGRTHVKVHLRNGSAGIRLQVIDAGEGFDVNARGAGLGLISMEERARLIGGTLKIDSKIGDGTRITVDVPLPQA